MLEVVKGGEIAWHDQKLEEIERACEVGADESRQNPQPAPIETKPPVGYPGASPIPLGDDRTVRSKRG
jgi:hypothetical protein